MERDGRSGNQPVVYGQPRNFREVLRVVRDNREVIDHCGGGNHQVHCRDGPSLIQKFCSKFPEFPRDVGRDGQHVNIGEQFQKPLVVFWRCVLSQRPTRRVRLT